MSKKFEKTQSLDEELESPLNLNNNAYSIVKTGNEHILVKIPFDAAKGITGPIEVLNTSKFREDIVDRFKLIVARELL